MDPLTLTLIFGAGALFLFANKGPKALGGQQNLNQTSPNNTSGYQTTQLSGLLNGAVGTLEGQLTKMFNTWNQQQASNGGVNWSSSGQNPTPQDYADGGLRDDGTPVLLALPSAGDGSSGTSGASSDSSTGALGGIPGVDTGASWW